MSSASVHAIVVNWNGGEDTARCLARLVEQGVAAAHLHLVDNGSTDGSVALARLAEDLAAVSEEQHPRWTADLVYELRHVEGRKPCLSQARGHHHQRAPSSIGATLSEYGEALLLDLVRVEELG